jgi:hypothetical protein
LFLGISTAGVSAVGNSAIVSPEGVSTTVSSWKSVSADPGAQIDLVIDRRDQVVNLCEIKYSTEAFAINKAYDLNLRNKAAAFAEETKTGKALHKTMITTFGLKRNAYGGEIQSEVTLDDLFR